MDYFYKIHSVSKRSKTKSFGSGSDNPCGLNLKLSFDEDSKTAYGEFVADERFEGEPGEIHPGILTAILDEAMIKINESMNFDTTTGEINVRFLMSARIGESLYIRGWFIKKNRKVIENRAEVENEIGKIVARAKGKYIEREE
ncbi:MAG: PaaI family thioesterase [Leptospiraceae bacterium]|nr:PaaI family thioesterase [Leptospiraceae bacterium]MDW7976920.1 PaaI family thioesterase [Leptospiraceae bacterium]